MDLRNFFFNSCKICTRFPFYSCTKIPKIKPNEYEHLTTTMVMHNEWESIAKRDKIRVKETPWLYILNLSIQIKLYEYMFIKISWTVGTNQLWNSLLKLQAIFIGPKVGGKGVCTPPKNFKKFITLPLLQNLVNNQFSTPPPPKKKNNLRRILGLGLKFWSGAIFPSMSRSNTYVM